MTTTPALPNLLDADAVGEWLSMHPRRVVRMAKRGEIPAIRLPDGDFLFDPAELLMWLDHLRDQPREVSHVS